MNKVDHRSELDGICNGFFLCQIKDVCDLLPPALNINCTAALFEFFTLWLHVWEVIPTKKDCTKIKAFRKL